MDNERACYSPSRHVSPFVPKTLICLAKLTISTGHTAHPQRSMDAIAWSEVLPEVKDGVACCPAHLLMGKCEVRFFSSSSML